MLQERRRCPGMHYAGKRPDRFCSPVLLVSLAYNDVDMACAAIVEHRRQPTPKVRIQDG